MHRGHQSVPPVPCPTGPQNVRQVIVEAIRLWPRGLDSKERLEMAIRLVCARCSFVFDVHMHWTSRGTPPAPVHPIHDELWRITWQMCAGSARPGSFTE